MHLCGILLAAGAATRFGSAKLMAPLPSGPEAGAPLGAAACRHLVASLPDTVAVVRPGDDALATALRSAGAEVVLAPRASEGMGASLAAGVAARPNADGWIVALADMPWIATATITAVRNALLAGAPVAAPFHRGQRGHPVGFASLHRAQLLALTGDQGARTLLQAHAGALVRIDVDDPGALRDVDRPLDLS